MNQTHSIIVYRNPVEQAFWESGLIVPLGGCLLTFLLVFVLLMKLAGRHATWRGTKATVIQWAAGLTAAAAAIYVFTLLMV